jgi:predicted secreted protein
MSAAAIHWVVLGGAFAIFWFLALQIVMPIGAHSPHEVGEDVHPGADPGAPANPRILLKVAIATGAAVVAWAIFYGLILAHVVDL